MRFYPGIAGTQELDRARHSVDVKVLAFGLLFIHELEDRVIRVGVLEDGAGDLKESPAQMGRTMSGDMDIFNAPL